METLLVRLVIDRLVERLDYNVTERQGNVADPQPVQVRAGMFREVSLYLLGDAEEKI